VKLENIRAVLFDLDGTLVDTAPDLGHALNLQRTRHGLPPLADELIRPQASHGARGLLGLGFDLHLDDPHFASMREEFLQLYADNICRHSRPFPASSNCSMRWSSAASPGAWSPTSRRASPSR